VAWVRARDPGLLTLKRSVRAAVVIPSAFGLATALFADAQVALFAVFGAFALCLFVDFRGRTRTRVVSYLALLPVGAALISLGTVVSTHKVAAVVVMMVVGFVVLFAGILSPQVAAAATATLLTFVLPVAVAEPPSEIGPRLLGWALAAAFSVPACLLVWPSPWQNDLRLRLHDAVGAVGRLAAARATGALHAAADTEVSDALAALRRQFQGTPYPPVSAVGTAVALSKLVGRVEWVAGNAVLAGDPEEARDPGPVRTLVETVAGSLERSARLVCDGHGRPVDDPRLVDEVRRSSEEIDRLVSDEMADEIAFLAGAGAGAGDGDDPRPGAEPLGSSFRARVLGLATEMVNDAVLEAAGAQPVGDRRLGPVDEPTHRPVWSRLTTHLSARSVWFRNALRGAVGLGLAVAVVEVTDVEHGFWVVLGTLSVLRSNALGTGATALRAMGGTVVGFVIGSAVMIAVGDHTPVLWALLPFAVLISGAAPAMISFAAGQAGFTVTVVVVFNLIQPTGWRVGLTRIEDVVLGCAVSVVVGLLFWPRGATAALGRALSDAFVANCAYLADAVDRLTTSSHRVDTSGGQRTSHRTYLRLDDAYRQFLAERGAKVVPVEPVVRLLTGANRLRLAAFTLGSLPAEPTTPARPELEPVAVAGAVLRDAYASSLRWYRSFAAALAERDREVEPPPGHDEALADVLRVAFDDARAQHREDRLATVVRMFWAAELLEAQHAFQSELADSAGLFLGPAHRGSDRRRRLASG
jgi:uncharacterized membrane protein YccC